MTLEPAYTDKQLFTRLSQGDESAFRLIYDQYRLRLYGLAVKMTKSPQDAEEIVQETFLSIWDHKGRFGQVDDPPAYIFTIAYNKIYNYLKHIARDAALLQGIISRMTDHANDTIETIDFRESGALVAEALIKLPPQQRRVYELSRQQGLSYDQIAAELNISRHTVRNHLVEALRSIRAHLETSASVLLVLLQLLKK